MDAEKTWRVVYLQTWTGGTEVLHSGVKTHAAALLLQQQAIRLGVGPGGAVYVEEEEMPVQRLTEDGEYDDPCEEQQQ